MKGITGDGNLCTLTFLAKAPGDAIVQVTKAAARNSGQSILPVLAVLVIMAASVTLLPAVLGFAGHLELVCLVSAPEGIQAVNEAHINSDYPLDTPGPDRMSFAQAERTLHVMYGKLGKYFGTLSITG